MKNKNFLLRTFDLLRSPAFIFITFLGNSLIAMFAWLFYFLEKDINPNLNGFIDALWWSFSTATTVGYGDIIPITVVGKIVGILLMLLGTAYFAIYTAFFAQVFFKDAFSNWKKIEKEEASIEENLEKIRILLVKMEKEIKKT